MVARLITIFLLNFVDPNKKANSALVASVTGTLMKKYGTGPQGTRGRGRAMTAERKQVLKQGLGIRRAREGKF